METVDWGQTLDLIRETMVKMEAKNGCMRKETTTTTRKYEFNIDHLTLVLMKSNININTGTFL